MLKRILLSSLAVFALAYFLPGIVVSNYAYAILVAVVLGLLNALVKPILIIFTLPVTVLTMGLFLLVINAAIVMMADNFLSGFEVNGFWNALLFSILLAFLESIMQRSTENK